MIFFGIDPGLLHTGFGVVRQETSLSYIDCGTISAPVKESLPFRLSFIYDNLRLKILEHEPDFIAVEEIFVARNSGVALKLGHVRGVILLAASHAGIGLCEYSSTLIKKSVVGFGRADKHQVGSMVKILLPLSEADSEHSSDALAVAITAAHHAGR